MSSFQSTWWGFLDRFCHVIYRMKERGPFNLGKWSRVINFASFAVSPQFIFIFLLRYSIVLILDDVPWQFIIFICVLFVLPTARPVTRSNMNYAVVSIGGIFFIVGLAWVTWGRTRFVGSVHTNSGAESLGPLRSEIPSKGWNCMNACAALVMPMGFILWYRFVCIENLNQRFPPHMYIIVLQLHRTFQILNWLKCTKWTKNSSYKWTKCWRWELH